MSSPPQTRAVLTVQDALLLLAVFVASMLCWLPSIIEPTLDAPVWVPLVVIALCSGLATILSGGRWQLFLCASTFATLVGVLGGSMVWPQEDGIAQSYSGVAAVLATIAAAFIVLIAGLIGRRIMLSRASSRRVVGFVLACAAAYGPVALAVRPLIVARRLACNDRLAAARVQSLAAAMERTSSEPGGPGRLCDQAALRRNYAGPAFTEQDWRYILGNFVTEDGYAIGITIDCSQHGQTQPLQYLISAMPKRGISDGTRQFWSDKSCKLSCGTERDLSLRRNVCMPCSP